MKTSPFWSALQSVPGNTALFTTWKLLLGTEFDAFKFLFLRIRSGPPADFVPCPWNCGCMHKVVSDPNGTTLGVCQCENKLCGTYTLLPDERTTFDVDWNKLAHNLGQALEFEPKTAQLGIFNTQQLGVLSATTVPVILSLACSQQELVNAVTALVTRFGQPFILLAPTGRFLGHGAKEILDNIGAAFFALEEHLKLACHTKDNETCYGLSCATSPAKIFAAVAPLQPPPSDEELARRTFLALQEKDPSVRRRPPTLYTVFQLYCVKEMTMPQVARKCRCSISTVANRLKLLQAKTGVAPDELRRVSGIFNQYDNDFRQGRRNHRQRVHSQLSA